MSPFLCSARRQSAASLHPVVVEGQQTLGEAMLKIARYALFAFGLVFLPISASAEDSIVKRPQDIVYKSPYVGYPEVAVVYGDTQHQSRRHRSGRA